MGWTATPTNRTGAVDAAGVTLGHQLARRGRGYWGGHTGAGGGAWVGDTTPAIASTDPGGVAMGAVWGGGQGQAAGAVAGVWGEILHLRGGHWGDTMAPGQPAEVGPDPRGEAGMPRGR